MPPSFYVLNCVKYTSFFFTFPSNLGLISKWPFYSHDPISNSPYCLPNHSYDLKG